MKEFITAPLGDQKLTILLEGGQVTDLLFPGAPLPLDARPAGSPMAREAAAQLEEYLAGRRRVFDLPLAPRGTPFQQEVWAALCRIPYGETRSYADIAAAIGRPKACRAVGMANNRNPIPIFIPCHRVIGKKGSLVGYAGGLFLKERLLLLEQGRETAVF